MNKHFYQAPVAEVSYLMSENIICASGADGSNEDFGKGTGFSFDLFESVNPF